MNHQRTDSETKGSVFGRVLAMGLALAGLYLIALGLTHAPCWGLFFLTALIAWPIWQYQQEVVLFERRAILERIAAEHSRIRRWFWHGRLTRVIQVLVALFWATLLLAFAALLQPQHWAILAADMLLLSMAVGPLRRRLATQIQSEQVGLVMRRWPLMLTNLLLLTLAFMLIDFVIVGVTDTRGEVWHQLAEQSFLRGSELAVCPAAGLLIGALTAVRDLTWHALEILIPQLPHQELKLAAWGIFLLQAGTFAYVFTRLMLGVVSLLEQRHGAIDAVIGESTLSRAFMVTIIVLAIPYLYATIRLADFDPGVFEERVRTLVDNIDPCGTPDPLASVSLAAELGQQLSAAAESAKASASTQIDRELHILFAELEPRVDLYLDWYFTVVGEYERLAALATGGLAELLIREMQRHLFDDSGFAERIDQANAKIAGASVVKMTEAGQALGARLQDEIRSDPCGLRAVDLSAFGDLDRDRMRASTALGAGAAGALTAKMLAKKTGAAVATKIAAKKSFQTAAALAGKAVAKKGGTILLGAAGGAAVCSPGGPLAVVCGIVAGTVVWLSVDKAFIEIDEALLRDQMRTDILAALADEKVAVALALKQQHQDAIHAMATQIQDSVDRVFIPARDGL